jgi:hypothetical protein
VNPRIPAGDVLSLAQEQTDDSYYGFAEEHGADIIPVDDNKSFAVWYQPDDFDPAIDTVLVSLHGHAGWATKDFEVWYPQVTAHHYAYLGVQWWFGRSLEMEGYYDDAHIYDIIADQLSARGIPAGHVIFQGFSMGSARSYGVSMYDRTCGDQFFGVNIANAGFWEDDYPLYADILDGDYGSTLLADTQWILFCAGQDEGYKTSCESMQHTIDVIEQFGGSVALSFEDPNGSHGSFMMNSENSERALMEAETILNE